MNEYDYDDEILDREQEEVREIDLPAVVRNWEKVATSYSRYNNIPAIIGFYSLLGDLVQLVQIQEYIFVGFKQQELERQH